MTEEEPRLICPVCERDMAEHNSLDIFKCKGEFLRSHPEMYELCLELGTHDEMVSGTTCEKCGFKKPKNIIGFSK